MSNAKQASLTRIAFHEAGHAVAAWAVGARLHRVTIVPGNDYLGMVRHSRALNFDGWYRWDDRAQLRMAREIKISYAGALAVKRAFPGSRWRSGAKADFHAVANLLLHVYQDKREQRLWSSLLMLQTEALLARRWSSVEAIVDALLKRRTLTGAEVKRVIQDDFHARRGKSASRHADQRSRSDYRMAKARKAFAKTIPATGVRFPVGTESYAVAARAEREYIREAADRIGKGVSLVARVVRGLRRVSPALTTNAPNSDAEIRKRPIQRRRAIGHS